MGLSEIVVRDGGRNYLSPPVVSISGGAGSGAEAEAMLSGGGVSSVSVVKSGSGFTSAPNVNFLSGSGATVVAELVPTTVSSVVLNDPNTISYASPPAVTLSFDSDQNPAVASSVVMKTMSAELVNGGLNYLPGDTVLVSGGTASQSTSISVIDVSSTGAITSFRIANEGSYTALPNPLLTNLVVGGSGQGASFNISMGVASINLSSGGGSYRVPPRVLISGTGSGTEAHTVITSGSVGRVIVDNPGSGHLTIPSVTFSSGSGASAVAVLTNGRLSAINLTSGGQLYVDVPQVTIPGGATAEARLAATSVANVAVTAPGAGYTGQPTLSWAPGPNQTPSASYPISRVNLSHGVARVLIGDPGINYKVAPQVRFSAPNLGGTPAQATSRLGVGSGSFSILAYDPSRDYYLTWKNQTPSDPLLARSLQDQMSAVLSYFTNLGYNITQATNPVSSNTMIWNLRW
jgi:hypothetical protein